MYMASKLFTLDEKILLTTQKLIKVLESKITLLEGYVSLQDSAHKLKDSSKEDTDATNLKSCFSKEIEKFSQTLMNIDNRISELNVSRKFIEEGNDSSG